MADEKIRKRTFDWARMARKFSISHFQLRKLATTPGNVYEKLVHYDPGQNNRPFVWDDEVEAFLDSMTTNSAKK